MQFTLTDLQNEIKENSNKLLKENIDLLETIQKVDENCRIDKKVWDLVIDQGWLALDVPEEDGGLGFSNTDTASWMNVFPISFKKFFFIFNLYLLIIF